MEIPVKDSAGNIRLLHLIQEVTHMQTDGSGHLLVYSEGREYRLLRIVEDWARLLEVSGFLRVDRGTIVNLNKTWTFDSALHVLRPKNEAVESRGIPVAGTMVRPLNRLLKKMSENAEE